MEKQWAERIALVLACGPAAVKKLKGTDNTNLLGMWDYDDIRQTLLNLTDKKYLLYTWENRLREQADEMFNDDNIWAKVRNLSRYLLKYQKASYTQCEAIAFRMSNPSGKGTG